MPFPTRSGGPGQRKGNGPDARLSFKAGIPPHVKRRDTGKLARVAGRITLRRGRFRESSSGSLELRLRLHLLLGAPHGHRA